MGNAGQISEINGDLGPPSEGVVQARFVAQLDEAAVKRMQEFKANLGKTVIAGEVKEIAETCRL